MPIQKVLVVDDSKTELMFLTDLLQKKGMQVRTAENAEEAFRRLAEEKPDLILMDVVMPEMDGVEATAYLRGKPELAHLPIVALSANASLADQARALSAGANAFLPKPIERDALLAQIGKVLSLTWISKQDRRME